MFHPPVGMCMLNDLKENSLSITNVHLLMHGCIYVVEFRKKQAFLKVLVFYHPFSVRFCLQTTTNVMKMCLFHVLPTIGVTAVSCCSHHCSAVKLHGLNVDNKAN